MSYDQFAPLLIANGLCPLPIEPGTKAPGKHVGGGRYVRLTGWTTATPILEPQPGAGVGVRTGDGLVAIDIDTDHIDIGCARLDALGLNGLETITKRGKRGETLFLRIANGWLVPSRRYAIGDRIVVEVLAKGKQTVIPPTTHPETGAPYTWGKNGWTLWGVDHATLPTLPVDFHERIELELKPFGYQAHDDDAGEQPPKPAQEGESDWQDFNRRVQDKVAVW